MLVASCLASETASIGAAFAWGVGEVSVLFL